MLFRSKEKSEFFNSNNNSVPTIQTITQRQPTSRNNRQQTFPRQVTNTICRCCGIAGHDVGSTGYDYAASFIMTNAYLRNNSNNKQFIISQFKQHQQNRLNKLTSRKSSSNRIQNKAQNKRIGLSPQMRLLVDAIGEEIEAELDDYPPVDILDEQIATVYDLLPNDPVSDEFHDTTDTNVDELLE